MGYDSASSQQRTAQEGSRAVRLAVEREAITQGGWEDDAVDRVLEHSADKITTDNGKVGGVKDAVDAYKAATPDAFVVLSTIATNPNLPAHERFAFSYREVMKARARKQGLARVQSRAIRGTQRAAS